MKRLATWILVVAIVFSAAGCKGRDADGEIQLGQEWKLEDIVKIDLTNAHNGQTTAIADENAISEITAFVGELAGSDGGSGKGFYEGSYTLKFYHEDGRTDSVGFGDSDCFYLGQGADGYPVRYALRGKTVSGDIIPFLARFDESGFSWAGTDQ